MKWIDPVNMATEHQKVSTFMRGLELCYKFHVWANNPVTLANAVNTAKVFELSYNELVTQPIGIVQNNNANKIKWQLNKTNKLLDNLLHWQQQFKHK